MSDFGKLADFAASNDTFRSLFSDPQQWRRARALIAQATVEAACLGFWHTRVQAEWDEFASLLNVARSNSAEIAAAIGWMSPAQISASARFLADCGGARDFLPSISECALAMALWHLYVRRAESPAWPALGEFLALKKSSLNFQGDVSEAVAERACAIAALSQDMAGLVPGPSPDTRPLLKAA